MLRTSMVVPSVSDLRPSAHIIMSVHPKPDFRSKALQGKMLLRQWISPLLGQIHSQVPLSPNLLLCGPTVSTSYAHTQAHTHLHMHVCMYMHTFIHAHRRTHTHAWMYVHAHAHTHAHMHVHVHAHTHTHFTYAYLNEFWIFFPAPQDTVVLLATSFLVKSHFRKHYFRENYFE